MKNSLQTVTLILMLLCGTGLGIYWFLNTYELREVSEYDGWKGEARENQLYALRLFLKRMGIPAQSKDLLTELPDTKTVLVLNTQRYTLPQTQVHALIQWVKQGGHLITRGRAVPSSEQDFNSPSSHRQDLLQHLLGIETGSHLSLDETTELPLQTTIAQQGRTYAVELDLFYSLNSDDYSWKASAPRDGEWLIQQQRGQGLITLISELSPFENHALGQYDHAEFFWQLLHQQQRQPEHIWLLAHDDYPSLLSLMWDNAWTLILSLTALLSFAAWHFNSRFGPLIQPPELARKNILEHIQASGRFIWHNQAQGQQQLTQSLRDSILDKTKRHTLNWQQLTPEARYTQLAQYADLTSEQVQILFEQDKLSDQQFIQLSQLHQRIRNSHD